MRSPWPPAGRSICHVAGGHSSVPEQENAIYRLAEVLADETISMITTWEALSAPASPLEPEIFDAMERVTEAMWPGIPVIPTMLTGATDGLYLRNAGIPTYGVSGIYFDIDDVRAHGRDERVGVKQFYEGQEFLYRLVTALSSPP